MPLVILIPSMIVIVGIVYLFIKLTMPEPYRSIKITVDGLNEEFDYMIADAKADVASIKSKLANR